MATASQCLLLLSLTSFASTNFVVIRRDEGDQFIWYGNNNITCDNFSGHTAYYDGRYCGCNYQWTFSPESHTCKSFEDQGPDQVYYRFDRSNLQVGETSVSAVHADCGPDNICTLNSTVAKFNTELPITTLKNRALTTSSNCIINSVVIMHGCIPRPVDLELRFIARSDNRLYLQLHVHRTTPLNHLEGELFLLDITCASDGPNKKMMFKYAGKSYLTKPGPFDIPAYDPSHTCSEMTTSTTAVTPTSTGIPNHTHGSKHTRDDIEIGVTLGLLLFALFVIVILSYYIFKWFRNRCGHNVNQGNGNQNVNQGNGNQNPAFEHPRPRGSFNRERT